MYKAISKLGCSRIRYDFLLYTLHGSNYRIGLQCLPFIVPSSPPTEASSFQLSHSTTDSPTHEFNARVVLMLDSTPIFQSRQLYLTDILLSILDCRTYMYMFRAASLSEKCERLGTRQDVYGAIEALVCYILTLLSAVFCSNRIGFAGRPEG